MKITVEKKQVSYLTAPTHSHTCTIVHERTRKCQFETIHFLLKGGGWWYSGNCQDAYVGQLTGRNDGQGK